MCLTPLTVWIRKRYFQFDYDTSIIFNFRLEKANTFSDFDENLLSCQLDKIPSPALSSFYQADIVSITDKVIENYHFYFTEGENRRLSSFFAYARSRDRFETILCNPHASLKQCFMEVSKKACKSLFTLFSS